MRTEEQESGRLRRQEPRRRPLPPLGGVRAGALGLRLMICKDLEEEMATHSSILAWRIPWTEEPGRLQSMGSKESDTTKVT